MSREASSELVPELVQLARGELVERVRGRADIAAADHALPAQQLLVDGMTEAQTGGREQRQRHDFARMNFARGARVTSLQRVPDPDEGMQLRRPRHRPLCAYAQLRRTVGASS